MAAGIRVKTWMWTKWKPQGTTRLKSSGQRVWTCSLQAETSCLKAIQTYMQVGKCCWLLAEAALTLCARLTRGFLPFVLGRTCSVSNNWTHGYQWPFKLNLTLMTKPHAEELCARGYIAAGELSVRHTGLLAHTSWWFFRETRSCSPQYEDLTASSRLFSPKQLQAHLGVHTGCQG